MTKYILNTCDAEYEKDSKIKKEDIKMLKEWQQKQPHLPEISEYMLQQFYHCCDYSLQRAKNLIEFHYSFKHEASEFFEGRDFEPPRYTHTYFDIIHFLELGTLPSGCRLFYVGLKDADPVKYNYTIAVGMLFQILMTMQLEQGTCPGYEFVYNFEGTVTGHLATTSLSGHRKMITYVQDSVPLKVLKVHIVNVSSLLSKLLMLVKPFMRKELFDTIRLHPNLDTLFEEVPREFLPKDFHGSLPHTRNELNEIMRAKVKALHEPVVQELKLRSDETKRIGKSPLEQTGLTSMNGSFKQLVLD